MAETFRDLVDVDKLQRLMERFHELTGLPAGIIAPDDDILVAVGWQKICTEFHRLHPLTCGRCHESDATLRLSASGGEMAEYRCGNGLWDVAIPLAMGDTLYATLFVGQFLYDDDEPDLDFFRAQATECGFNEEDYLAAVKDIPRYSRPHMARVIAYYRELAGFIVDIAASRSETQQVNRELEGIVAARTAELQRSNAELQQFAYAASHDLQEPLRMVSSYVQLIKRRMGDAIDPELDEFIGFATDGAKRMSGMIQDLLEYSRVHSRAAEPAPVDSSEAVAMALQNLQLAVDSSKAVVEIGSLPVVLADPGQLVRLFQNLLSNAIKYVDDGATPQISVTAEQTGDMWRFAVADRGIGIAADQREAIFGIFHRLHGRGRYAGNGVGLSIAKRIVERHGGRIWVEDNPGGGSIFRFTLPRG